VKFSVASERAPVPLVGVTLHAMMEFPAMHSG
jgi:hypothetical protein